MTWRSVRSGSCRRTGGSTLVGAALTLVGLPGPAGTAGPKSFVNWESPHVHPLEVTPDGARLLAVNTADNRLEVFTIAESGLEPAGAVPVGLDPVSVRARSETEAWVVNHVSDSISIVDLATLNTRATIHPGDEPADVIFAGSPQRAFVTVSSENRVVVYDPQDLAVPPVVLDLEGEDPRALATDGVNVFVAIFESGNRTTVLNEQFVVSVPGLNPYPGDPNPPPNDGEAFAPPIDPDLPSPPPVSMIVRKDTANAWRDDNGGDWSAAVTWDLHDHDAAVIDANTLGVRYVRGGMNLNMHLDVAPTGLVAAVGTDAVNEVRFEPNVNGILVRSIVSAFTAGSESADVVLDLNPHLGYDTPTIPPEQRELSVGDPRAVKWSTPGDRVYIAGMGSNNLLVLASSGVRIGLVDVGQGPTGIALDDAHGRVYVLNKFDGTISTVDAAALTEITRTAFYDPTPVIIRAGRPHLYDTHRTSGLGQASCASCHVDGRMDQLAWDLGDPSGTMKQFNQTCIGGGACADWHPMKGPMTTQTLFGIVGTEPLHWRGDREDLAAFNDAFESLLGDDEQLTDEEMDEFEAFVATLTFPPNPFRNLDGSLRTLLENGGNAVTGETLFSSTLSMDMRRGGGFSCVGCHALPTGSNFQILAPLRAGGITQNSKTAQLRNVYDKVGFHDDGAPANKGFGFIHDGSFKTLPEFLGFFFNVTSQEIVDLEAFLLSFATDTHAGVGVQTTLREIGLDPARHSGRAVPLGDLVDLAEGGEVGLVAHGLRDALARGFAYLGGGVFQSDRAAEQIDLETLVGGVGPAAEMTFTIVPLGSQTRIGIDRDEDGFFDRDELDAGSDPADPHSVPDPCPEDLDGSGAVDFGDVLAVLAAWGNVGGDEDLDQSGVVDFGDLLVILAEWGDCV